ncbi:MAG: hypothetical protein NVV63_12060 [Opitutus sp.]|nr:hypothetical protein [Opitutus sp.]
MQVAQHIIVPASQYGIALSGQESGTFFVMQRTRMLATVDFNDQRRFAADEISKIGANRNLTDKLMPAQLASAKDGPQALFGIRRIATQ